MVYMRFFGWNNLPKTLAKSVGFTAEHSVYSRFSGSTILALSKYATVCSHKSQNEGQFPYRAISSQSLQ
jgi:hypothetical protein